MCYFSKKTGAHRFLLMKIKQFCSRLETNETKMIDKIIDFNKSFSRFFRFLLNFSIFLLHFGSKTADLGVKTGKFCCFPVRF